MFGLYICNSKILIVKDRYKDTCTTLLELISINALISINVFLSVLEMAHTIKGSRMAQTVKYLPANSGGARDPGLIPELVKSPGVGNGNPH